VTLESNTDAVFCKTVKNEQDTVQYCIQWVTSVFGLVFLWVFRWDQTSEPNLIQKVKWRFWFGLSQLLSENFRWAFHWVRTLDSAIRSAKVNLNNSVLVQFTLRAVDSLIP